MNRSKFLLDAGGTEVEKMYPPYAWPGGYQILYLDKNGCILCPPCIWHLVLNGEPGPYTPFNHWEGDTVWCEDCGEPYESEYGNPEDEQETE